jgi:hypothetical protein
MSYRIKDTVVSAKDVKSVLMDYMVTARGVSGHGIARKSLKFEVRKVEGVLQIFAVTKEPVQTRTGGQKNFEFSTAEICGIVAKSYDVKKEDVSLHPPPKDNNSAGIPFTHAVVKVTLSPEEMLNRSIQAADKRIGGALLKGPTLDKKLPLGERVKMGIRNLKF